MLDKFVNFEPYFFKKKMLNNPSLHLSLQGDWGW